MQVLVTPAVVICLQLLAHGAATAPAAAPATHVGDPLPGLTNAELTFFASGQEAFAEVDSVFGNEPDAEGRGLGPRYNLNSCQGCHAHPATGGSSPKVNPQVAMATQYGAQNVVPDFITSNGPVREARFRSNVDGSRDGGVHNLLVSSLGRCRPRPALGLDRSTYYRRVTPKAFGPRQRRAHPRELTQAERQAVLNVLHEERFAELSPGEVHAMLLDEGRYLCSERTMYRVLAANAEVRERRRQRHDGRTSDLHEAILAHASHGRHGIQHDERRNAPGAASEADRVIYAYQALSGADRAALIALLKSL